jgi:hypothetical protein
MAIIPAPCLLLDFDTSSDAQLFNASALRLVLGLSC